MGYRGKLAEQAQARELRAECWTLADIAAELGVAKSSVSLWVRDVPFEPSPRRTGPRRRPTVSQERKAAEVERLLDEGRALIGHLSSREFLVLGAALYAGEGGKGDGSVCFSNTDPRMVSSFLAWLRRFFVVDESRLRVRIYLHEGLDLEAATAYWSELTDIPPSQFRKPYRAVADPSIRKAKHPMGCVYIGYYCSKTHRSVMGLVNALLASEAIPG